MTKRVYLSLAIFLTVILAIIFFHIYSNRYTINIVYSDSVILKKHIKELAHLMENDIALKQHKQKNIDFYIANFLDSNIPEIKDNSSLNILWLGSLKNIDIPRIKKFDYVFVNSFDLYFYLKNNIKNLHYIPMFTIKNDLVNKSCNENDDNSNCYWVVIGDEPNFMLYLANNNIKYKHFRVADEKTILSLWDDLSNISGIATSNDFFNFNSLDVSPLFLMAATSNIPIVAYKKTFMFNMLTLFFNGSINVYSSYDDIDFIFKNKINTNNTKIIIDSLFSQIQTKNRIVSILTQKKYISPIIDNMIDIWCASKPLEYSNGDYMFSFDLIKNINSKYKSISNPASIMQHIGEVNIYIRGMVKFSEQDINRDSISIIYLLYPAIDNFNDKNFKISLDEYVLSISEELKLFDAVAVASYQIHNALKKIGIISYYVPQFTDVDKFYYDPDDKLKSEILFVGTKYFDRPTVPILLENNINVDVYGPNWNGIEKGTSIDNRILRKYYSSAKIVLNDTRPDMKQLNFISNRIFDASACGTLVISDYVKEIEDVYGDSVPMWKTKEELIELVKYYLDPKNEKERLEKAKRAQEITLKNFTSDIIGKKFENIIENIKNKKKL